MLLVDKGVVIDGTYIRSSYFVQFSLFLQSKDIPIGLDQVCEESGCWRHKPFFFSTLITFLMGGALDFRYILLSSVCEGLTVCEGNGCWGSES